MFEDSFNELISTINLETNPERGGNPSKDNTRIPKIIPLAQELVKQFPNSTRRDFPLSELRIRTEIEVNRYIET